MQNQSTTNTYPWDIATAPNTAPDLTNPYVPQPITTPTPYVNAPVYPMPEDPPIPGTEEFHDFMCWLAGFTDPITPPSQERWEAFQDKVKDMAALFWEYKKEQRAREFNQPLQVSLTTTAASADNASLSVGLAGDKTYSYEELSTM